MTATKDELVAAHLRYGAMGAALRGRAYAQIIAKALYQAGRERYVSVPEIQEACGNLLDAGSPSADDVEAAIQVLDEQGVIQHQGESYRLRRGSWDRLNDQINRRRAKVERVYERHFPQEISLDDFRQWFDAATVEFFSQYGDKWVASVARREGALHPGDINLADLLSPIITSHGLDDHRDELIQGFRRWVCSENPEDNELVWALGLAMFAARLVASGIATDPITTRELRDSTVLLDTNALVVVALEAHRHAEAIAALGQALDEIGCRLAYIHPTKVEYQNLIGGWHRDTVRTVNKYGHEVVAKSDDAHIQTAVHRQCYLPSDYDRFYARISEPPANVDDSVPVVFLDNEEVDRWARAGANDAGRVHEIRQFWREARGRPKKKEAAKHDAAVTEVARQLRQQEDGGCWVLTLDRTMQALALQWGGPEGLPGWISLDALLQVLAIEHGGTGWDANEFAPILSQLIAHEVTVPSDTYQVEDLQWLDEIETEVGSLPKERVEEMARLVRRSRLSGAKRDDSELRLTVGRVAQRARDDAEKEAQRAVETAEHERERADTYRERLVEERAESIRRKAKRRAYLRGAAWLLATGAIGALAGWAFVSSNEGLAQADLIQLGITLGTPVVATAAGIWKHVVPSYRESVRRAGKRAEREVRRQEGGGE